MSELSDIRAALAKALSPLPEKMTVSLIGGKYDEGTERFAIRVFVGAPSPETEDRLDSILAPRGEQSICGLLERDPTLGGVVGALQVRSHSGHHLFKSHEGAEPELGSDVTAEVHRLLQR